jgi:hypothetical protein
MVVLSLELGNLFFFVETDVYPRERKVIIQVMGEQ